ncbi:MAG TPA: pyridoxamine 5'-phosphate oxidase family protein [Ktedonobacterales bacterium]|jgi:Pyridoxamine 5'-phosphate oxidase|nr:pyridoxamine 5'-phosphate oxidase family protein [Ktedonobacterales bacterium]
MILSEAVRALLDQPLIGRISVIDDEGYPHTIPIWFARDGEEVVFFSSRNTRKITYIQANPKGALTIGGDPYGSEGYLLKGEFALEDDVAYQWLREITYRYEPREVAEKDLAEWIAGWASKDLVILRFTPRRVVKV